MKQIISYGIAGMLGGLVCFGGLMLVQNKTIHENQSTKAKVVAETEKSTFSPYSNAPDFVSIAKIATPSVVHIFAEESEKLARENSNKRRNPYIDPWGFEELFGNDFFNQRFYDRQKGSGSGVIVSKDGYIITNNHVVGFADKIIVTTVDGKKYEAKKIGTDQSTDLAVIKIEANNLQAATYGNSDNLKVGEWVLAVGNPFDYLTSTVTAGIVSAKGRDLDIIEGEKSIEEFIQTDAAINPGNSGGALVSGNGELIGINTAIATPTGYFAGYSFAIPSNLVKNIVGSIIESGGNIERVGLGIGGFDVDNEITKELKLKVNKGFYVDEVETRSPAKFAGILPGDVITKINNKPVGGFDDIADLMKFSKKGDTLQVSVNRDGKDMVINTVLRKGL